jgi:hypothetical protein
MMPVLRLTCLFGLVGFAGGFANHVVCPTIAVGRRRRRQTLATALVALA